MKNYINKSAKRILSLALAVIMLAGCLFTANIGTGITASAETDSDTDYSDWNIQYWDGTVLKGWWTPETDGTYLITNANQLHYAAAGTRDGTGGKTFVIDPKIDAFIMQPKDVVDKIGIKYFIESTGGEDTRILFEEKFAAAGATPVNWSKDANNNIFNGDFNGSGVGIYGLYVDAVQTQAQAAAFLHATKDLDASNGGIEIKNLVIKSSYFKGYMRVSILTGIAWADTDSYVSVDSCIFANCYLLGQNKKNDTDLFATKVETGAMGIVAGSVNSEPIKLSNTLIYGNKTEYDFYAKAGDSNFETTTDAFNWVFRQNTGNGVHDGSIKNCIILDAVVNYLTSDSTTYCENVYVDTLSGYKNTVTQMIDHASVMGAQGAYFMPGLDWGNKWFAVKNDYPTPIYREKEIYVEAASTAFAGSGTEDDPYIIRSAKQLDQMIADGGMTGGFRAYYKVADDVKAIYLNDDVTTKEQAVALYNNNTGTFKNWNKGDGAKSFEGHFDGNGVTIYGMISSNRGSYGGSVGFFTKIGVTHGPNKDEPAVTTSDTTASISNVNFVGACIDSNSAAAVVASAVVGWRDTSADGTRYEDDDGNDNTTANDDIKPHFYINNVTVRDSSISTIASTFSSDTATSHSGTAAGIFAVMSDTPDHVVISNCLYDGGSCVLNDGDTSASRTKTAKAGIVSNPTGGNELTIENCVSIGEPAIPMVAGVDYSNRYNSGAYDFITVYGEVPAGFDTTAYTKLATCYDIPANSDGTTKTSFVMSDMQMLNWGGAWNLTEYNGRSIPMPKLSSETIEGYSTQLLKQNNGKGAVLPDKTRPGGYVDGTYGMYEEFQGSGTKEDPYLIGNALDLARAIACGGKDITTALYYKLVSDIDVGAGWISTTDVAGKYVYVPFEGHIDGDGHTIYNLYAIGENASLIPEIVGGASIKNLHIRDSHFIPVGNDGIANAFFGKRVKNGDKKVTIEGCSVENTEIVGSSDYIVGDLSAAEVINSYHIIGSNVKYRQYYVTGGTNNNENPPKIEDADFYGEEGVTDPVWYQGTDGIPRLVNRAKAMPEVDVAGDGSSDYSGNSLTALRRNLLGDEEYKYIYGDVNRNGKTNLSDLALLGRQLVGAYNLTADGFWRNAALGNIVIYYGENDNYDFARKLELALEAEFGKDVKKVVVGTAAIGNITYGNKSENGKLYVHKNDIYFDGTNYYKFNENLTTGAITPVQINDTAEIAKYALDGKCQIVVGNIPDKSAELADNSYKIEVEKTNSAIWLQGGSFTAVEQATLDFINNSNPDTNTLHSGEGTLQDTKKQSITVGSTPYYYAWGDEFDSDTLNKDKWNYCTMHNETDNGDEKIFNNLEVAHVEDFEKLYIMNNGKLEIWRGYYGDHNSSYDWGYKNLGSQYTGDNGFGDSVDSDDKYVSAGKIVTNKSMLVKQGYLEMKVTYPSDNHVFACWWLLGHHNSGNETQSNSLFGKVFKLNNAAAYSNADNAAKYAYDGKSNGINSSDPSTFKYILPQSSFEIDIVELMQSENKDVESNFTFHKFYRNGLYGEEGDQRIMFIDWKYVTTGTKSDKNAVEGPHYTLNFTKGLQRKNSKWTTKDVNVQVSEFKYNQQQSEASTYSQTNYNNYTGQMIHPDYEGNNWFTTDVGKVNLDDNQEYILGVEWDATNEEALFTFTVHKANADGTKGDQACDTIIVKDDIAYRQDTYKDNESFLATLSNLETDQETANQYMYMLIDNVFYSSNSSGTAWSNLLTQDSTSESTVMKIDYVRVYQKEGRRDIVTPDTEAFNNGDHFGYGQVGN